MVKIFSKPGSDKLTVLNGVDIQLTAGEVFGWLKMR